MGSKRKQRQGQRHKRPTRPNPEARNAQAPPQPEAVVGAVLESLAPALFGATPEVRTPSVERESHHTEEHRAHPRATVTVAIGLESESHFFAGLSGDISEGGVFVQTYRDLPVGSDVEIRFDLPDGELMAHGRVRWQRAHSDSSPPGVGIAFEQLGDDDRRMIQRFCEHRAPLYYDVEH